MSKEEKKSDKKPETKVKGRFVKWFSKNDKWIIPLTSVVMMFIAIIGFVFSSIQNKKNTVSQEEFTEKQRITDSLRDIEIRKQFEEQFHYQKYIDSLNFEFYKNQADRQFKSDSQTIKIALDEYNESSRPFVSIMETSLINDKNKININVHFGNKCNVPIEASEIIIDFSDKEHPSLKSSLNTVLAPNESAEFKNIYGNTNLNKLELITVKVKYHSIFNKSKRYYSTKKLIYLGGEIGLNFIEQSTGLISSDK